MLLKIYYLISTLLLPFYGIYINRRIKLKKEEQERCKERFGKPSAERKSGDLIWIHAASVGECLSALPVINEIEKITSVNQILLTSGTTSSQACTERRWRSTVLWRPWVATRLDSQVISRTCCSTRRPWRGRGTSWPRPFPQRPGRRRWTRTVHA